MGEKFVLIIGVLSQGAGLKKQAQKPLGNFSEETREKQEPFKRQTNATLKCSPFLR